MGNIMAFTTEHKGMRKTSIDISRKGSIVKERCRQLAEMALDFWPDRKISEEDLAYFVERYIGSDKETVRAYLGYYGRIRRAKTGEGYLVGQARKGYLEKFGFMHRAGRSWVIHAQVKLKSGSLSYQNNECSDSSKEKIYLSSSVGGESDREALANVETLGKAEALERGRKKEEEYREIEKFYSKDFPKIPELTLEEKRILYAKLSEESGAANHG